MELVQFNAVGRLANEYFGIGFVYMVFFQYASILAAWAAVTCVTTMYTSVPPHRDGNVPEDVAKLCVGNLRSRGFSRRRIVPSGVVVPPTVTLNCEGQGVAPHRCGFAAERPEIVVFHPRGVESSARRANSDSRMPDSKNPSRFLDGYGHCHYVFVRWRGAISPLGRADDMVVVHIAHKRHFDLLACLFNHALRSLLLGENPGIKGREPILVGRRRAAGIAVRPAAVPVARLVGTVFLEDAVAHRAAVYRKAVSEVVGKLLRGNILAGRLPPLATHLGNKRAHVARTGLASKTLAKFLGGQRYITGDAVGEDP